MKIITRPSCIALATIILLLPAILLGCGGDDTPLILAATNDLEGSGILQAWAEDFYSRTGRQVELQMVPDEEALAMVRHGECDLILTHMPDEETSLKRSGHLEGGQEIMRGDFVLLGPPQDPAGIDGMESAAEALKKIAEAGQTFILRIDGSGTAVRQTTILSVSEAGMTGGWLLPTDAGAEEALREASREKAYTLADRSSYERLAGELDLEILSQGDETLTDIYSAAAVSIFPYPDSDLAGALKFIDYLLTPDARSFLSLGEWSLPGE